ncbi:hypothetical protein CEN49_22035 [Fischerella thermalis CCMEE 5273]|nr:hypothetical protein CEN49_22035 [Fischerella thermalis CCMEE 5273]
MVLLTLYITGACVYGFLVTGYDKRQAIKGGWRVSERHLFTVAMVGGGFGVWAGMRHFRHKTTHPAFRMGIPILSIAHASLVIVLWIWLFA